MTIVAGEARRPGAATALVVVSAVSVAMLSGWWLAVPTAVLLALVARSWAADDRESSVWVAVVCWGAVGVFSMLSFGLVWPIPQLLGLAAAAGVLHRQGWTRPTWLDRGRADRPAALLALASIPLTTAALVAFIASGRTDLEAATEGLQSIPTWALPVVGVGFVLVNPTVEEVLFRGVLQTMVLEVSGSAGVAIAVQGLAFGAIHATGVPGGPLGMAMAGGWGVVLGIVRHRVGSIRLVWVVHVLANVAIYSTVVLLGLRDGVL